MITTIAISVAITVIILLILFIGMMNVSQSVIVQDNKTMLLRLTTLTDRYNTDQQQITKILTELTLQLHNFSIAVDEIISSIYDSAMKFPPDMDHGERRNMEFPTEEFVDKLNKAKLRLDQNDMEDLKKIFLDIEKFKEIEEEDVDFNED
tara:strand:+ start:505 stop:954 length:450 start_codon:yes stop_codon:yes gene_type:complete